MKTIKKEDLIKNKIYVHKNGNIVKYKYLTDFGKICGKHIGESKNIFNNNGGNFVIKELRLATPQEKHWLNMCIEADKFISYEEAMKTFIPEYVECIHTYNNRFNLNQIYKVLYYSNEDQPRITIEKTSRQYKHLPFDGSSWKFKPSTKKAYDAQFVVKEPEFVLPEKWFIKTNLDNINVIGNWFNKNKQNNIRDYSSLNKDNTTPVYSELCFPGVFHCDEIFHGLSSEIRGNDYVEITFEQFKQYVLKEPVTEETVEPLPQFKVIETIETITKVENNEGNQFFIGDVVTTDGSNITETIKSFEYHLNKTVLVAVFTNNSFIDINNIEHYIEPKVDFALPKKWCIKQNRKEINDWLNLNKINEFTYINTNSSNIVHFPAPVINDRLLYNSVQNGYTEITFEQFEKYVLNKTVK